jgi:hypothetical protein
VMSRTSGVRTAMKITILTYRTYRSSTWEA